MSAISDRIEDWLKARLDEENGSFEFTRNELALLMNCVPSQITYVLSTRFTNSQGYLIESHRGGGGSIVVHRINWEEPSQFIMHTVNSLPACLSQAQARVLLNNLADAGVIDSLNLSLMTAALSNRSLAPLSGEQRDEMRSRLLANMLCALLTGNPEN